MPPAAAPASSAASGGLTRSSPAPRPPREASSRAVASPIPEAPPVTSAASPANSVDCSAIHPMYHIRPSPGEASRTPSRRLAENQPSPTTCPAAGQTGPRGDQGGRLGRSPYGGRLAFRGGTEVGAPSGLLVGKVKGRAEKVH